MSNEHEQYIGKKLSECPDGTVAVVECGGLTVEMHLGDGRCCSVRPQRDGEYTPDVVYSATCHLSTVHTILHLGTPRPKTLADEEPGVAWKDANGDVWWRGDDSEVMFLDDGYPVHGEFDADTYTIRSNWTRIGKITGLRFEGDDQ